MTITSFYYLIFIAIGVVFYYLLPKSWQWVGLLILSIIFYYLAAVPFTIIYIVIQTLVAYISTIVIKKRRNKNCQDGTGLTVIFCCAVFLNFIFWFVLKGKGLWAPITSRLMHVVPFFSKVNNFLPVAALGMGYYTLQIIGYIIDCYWGNVEPQTNPFKLFLFVSFFPQLTAGPISRYSQLKTLYEKHFFSYQNLAFGAQRILWGLCKKLILAERIGDLLFRITSNLDTLTGFFSWVVILLYPLQMYADFSGCMDIVLGTAELFDIHLVENFNNPFFSRNSQEFWQRWHITLGSWAKDYVMYPLLKSKAMISLGKINRRRFGKRLGKFLTNAVGMFVLWMVMGIWHGGVHYLIGVSLWYWIVLMSGNLLEPYFEKLTDVLKIKTQSFSWHLFQSARTYLIYSVGAVIFSLGMRDGLRLLTDAVRVITVKDYANPLIFFDGTFSFLEFSALDLNLLILMIFLLLVVGALREKYGYARVWIQNQGILFRWMLWIGLFLIVLLFGKYGPEYNASSFIYQGF